MARDHGRVKYAIWTDEDFRDLTPEAQRLYLALITNPRLNYAGVIDWLPKRFANLSRHTDLDDVAAALEELAAGRYVIVDEDTDEVMVRSFVRHDGLLDQPNVVTAMVRDFEKIESADLRWTFLAELLRAKAENPSAKGWEKASDLLELARNQPSENPSGKGSGKGSPKGSPNPLRGVRRRDAELPSPAPTPSPTPAMPAPSGDGGAQLALVSESETQRAQRLTRHYDELTSMCNFPAVMQIVRKAIKAGKTDDQITTALASLATSGRSVTTDTLRIEIEGLPTQRKPSTTDQRVADALALSERLREQGL